MAQRPYRELLRWSLAVLAAVAYVVVLTDAQPLEKTKMLAAVIGAAATIAIIVMRAGRD